MEEKQMSESKQEFKGNLGFVWLVGILVILLGCTIGYVCKLRKEVNELKQAPQEQPQPVQQQVQPTVQAPVATQEQVKTEDTTVETKKETKKQDRSKDLVYTFASRKSKKDDYSFEIPYVNIDSEYAKEINKDIQKKYGNLDKLVKEAIEYPADTIGAIKYKTYTNNNILSLIIIEGGIIDYHFVYNIDIYTGEKISNNDILKAKNVSETKFLNKVEEVCKAQFEKYYGKTYDKKEKSELINETIKRSKKISTQMFLDKNNKINIIATMYIKAQFNEVEQIINTKL